MDDISVSTFYFLKDAYFQEFQDPKLMRNKEPVDGEQHSRPCYFAFREEDTNLMWFIPISSKVDKYREREKKIISKYGKCDTILFGEVLGRERAFLIQNMCPVTSLYVDAKYMDRISGLPVRISGDFERELIRAARRVLKKVRNNVPLIFPNVLRIEKELLSA